MNVENDYETLVAGGEDSWTITLTDPSGWVNGSDSWTWKLLIGPQTSRTSATVAVTASSATISTTTDTDDTMTLVFVISTSTSALLPTGDYYVEIEATEPDTTEHYYSEAHGVLIVRDPDGGG